jgi:hypothetical protein
MIDNAGFSDEILFLECRAQDNGVAATSIQAGRGLRIVEALAKRLNGRIDHQFSPGGSA